MSAYHILFLWFLVLGVALYDDTKMMLHRRKSHGIRYTNHRRTILIILQDWSIKIAQVIQECLNVAFLYVLSIYRIAPEIFDDYYY